MYKKRQMDNLERMADNYLLYNDETDVTEAPENDLENLDQLIVEEVERQLTSDRVDSTLQSVKDEL